MSDKSKSLLRPKVRFSRNSESTDDCTEKSGIFRGPRIRSVVNLKTPVIIIQSNSETNKTDIVDIPETTRSLSQTNLKDNNIQSVKPTSTSVPNISTKEPYDMIGKLQERTQNLKISSDKSEVQQLTPKLNSLSLKPSSIKPLKSSMKSSTNANGKKSEMIRNVRQNRGKSVERCGNKENVAKSSSTNKVSGPMKKKVEKAEQNFVKPKTITSSSVKTGSTKPSSSQLSNKPVNSLRNFKICPEPKIPVVGTMACMKLKKNPDCIRGKTKVKKNVVRNCSGPPPNVFVGPGITRQRTSSLEDFKQVYQKPEVLSTNKLDRPEYNSIMCTIKKLNEVKKKKVVTDIDSLPNKYKNLLVGKMSSALDFPASETVFKDLVDISVDENQLPLRITRSKDPDPRQKDLIPRLSDFFTPQYGEEYSEAFRIRPRSPEILDNWSAFRISDHINSLKNLLDET